MSGKFDFPDYQNRCPICGRTNCPVKNGFYYREWGDVWIQCYKCKNPPKGSHKTFSLLPWPLVPYHKYTVDELYLIDSAVKESPSCLDASYEIEHKLNSDASFNGTISEYVKLLLSAELKWEEFRRESGRATAFSRIPGTERQLCAWQYSHAWNDFLYGFPSHKKRFNPEQPQGP